MEMKGFSVSGDFGEVLKKLRAYARWFPGLTVAQVAEKMKEMKIGEKPKGEDKNV